MKAILLSCLGALLLSATPALPATTDYLDRAIWLSDVLADTITFDGPAAGASESYTTSSGLILDGVQFLGMFSDSAQSLQIINAGSWQPYYDWNSGAILRGEDYSPTYERRIKVIIPNNITAIGVDLMLGGVPQHPFQVRVNGTELYEVNTMAHPERAFFGLTSQSVISTLEFINPEDTYPMLDNFSFGIAMTASAAAVPEPATIALSGLALVLLALRRRR